jgi:hypothetical protein
LLDKQNKLEKELESKINSLSAALTRKIDDSFSKVNNSLGKIKHNDLNSEVAYLKQTLAYIYNLIESCNPDNYNEVLEIAKKIKDIINNHD